MEDSLIRDIGLQPLDAILDEIGLNNHQLVALSTEQLTHKQVQKARKGRRISVNIQRKILRALNAFPGAGEERLTAAGEDRLTGAGEDRLKPALQPGAGDEAEEIAPEKKTYELKELFTYRG